MKTTMNAFKIFQYLRYTHIHTDDDEWKEDDNNDRWKIYNIVRKK